MINTFKSEHFRNYILVLISQLTWARAEGKKNNIIIKAKQIH